MLGLGPFRPGDDVFFTEGYFFNKDTRCLCKRAEGAVEWTGFYINADMKVAFTLVSELLPGYGVGGFHEGVDFSASRF